MSIAGDQCSSCPAATPCPFSTSPPVPPMPGTYLEYDICPKLLVTFCFSIILTVLKFILRGRTYLDGDTVLITEIGEGDDAALLCVTDSTECCVSQRIGEFYYPSGRAVNVRASGYSLYRNRGDGFIRLNRRNNVLSPLGRYRCSIPDSSGVFRSIYINIGELELRYKS